MLISDRIAGILPSVYHYKVSAKSKDIQLTQLLQALLQLHYRREKTRQLITGRTWPESRDKTRPPERDTRETNPPDGVR